MKKNPLPNVHFSQPHPDEVLRTDQAKSRYNNTLQLLSDLREAAELVRDMRDRAHLSQTQLAERLGVTQARISEIESGNGRDGPTYTLLKRIARACEVPWPPR